MTSQEVN